MYKNVCIPDIASINYWHQVALLDGIVQGHALHVQHFGGSKARCYCNEQQDDGVWNVTLIYGESQLCILQISTVMYSDTVCCIDGWQEEAAGRHLAVSCCMQECLNSYT